MGLIVSLWGRLGSVARLVPLVVPLVVPLREALESPKLAFPNLEDSEKRESIQSQIFDQSQ